MMFYGRHILFEENTPFLLGKSLVCGIELEWDCKNLPEPDHPAPSAGLQKIGFHSRFSFFPHFSHLCCRGFPSRPGVEGQCFGKVLLLLLFFSFLPIELEWYGHDAGGALQTPPHTTTVPTNGYDRIGRCGGKWEYGSTYGWGWDTVETGHDRGCHKIVSFCGFSLFCHLFCSFGIALSSFWPLLPVPYFSVSVSLSISVSLRAPPPFLVGNGLKDTGE